MPEIEKLKTKPTEDIFQSSVDAAVSSLGKSPLTKEQKALLWAQWALETGRGNGMWNYNWGNIVSTKEDQNYIILATKDGPLKFRAYSNYEEGALAWIKWFSSKDDVWASLMLHDPTDFAHRLKIHNYYGNESETTYSNGLNKLYRERMGYKTIEPVKEESSIGGWLAAGIVGIIAFFSFRK